MGCKISQWRKSPNFWDEMWYLLRHTCWVIKSFASVLLCGPHISWPHISWPLVGQLQIMSQFLLVEKADDLNSELKRDYSNGQYKLLTPRDTDSFNTTPPSQWWGTASSHLSFKKLFRLEDKDEGRLTTLNCCCLKPSAHPHFASLDCGWCW